MSEMLPYISAIQNKFEKSIGNIMNKIYSWRAQYYTNQVLKLNLPSVLYTGLALQNMETKNSKHGYPNPCKRLT